ncbi:MAG TPA: metallopeptidase family protein [Acidimicrobiia bacterium]
MSHLPPPSKRGVMSRRAFERVVDEVLGTLPAWVVERIDNLQVVVEEWPSVDQDPDDEGMLGLYDGVSLAERGIDYFAAMPDTIWVFRGPHLELGLTSQELRAEIRTTVLHEIAHHLGIDDERLHDLGWD